MTKFAKTGSFGFSVFYFPHLKGQSNFPSLNAASQHYLQSNSALHEVNTGFLVFKSNYFEQFSQSRVDILLDLLFINITCYV